MAPRSRRRSSRRPAVLEDAASGLAREVIRRRSRASRAAPARRAEGDGRGMAIRDAADVAKWAKGRIAELEHEEAWVLVIDSRHRLLRAKRIERGDTGTSLRRFHPRAQPPERHPEARRGRRRCHQAGDAARRATKAPNARQRHRRANHALVTARSRAHVLEAPPWQNSATRSDQEMSCKRTSAPSPTSAMVLPR